MNKNPSRKNFTRQFYRGNIPIFIVAMLAIIVVAAVNLLISWLIQEIIDVSSGNSSAFSLAELVMLTFAAVFGIVFSSFLSYISRPRFIAKAMSQYKNFAFGELTKKGISAFSGEDTSTYISAFSNDVKSIEDNYLGGIFDLTVQVLLFVGAFAMMLWYSPALTAAAVAFTFLPVLASLLTGGKLAEAEKEVSQRNESFMSTLKDSLSGFSVVKSFKAEAAIVKLFSEQNGSVESSKCRRRKIALIINAIGSSAGVIAQFGVFLVGGYLSLSGKGITPGVIMVFVQLMGMVVQPISEVPTLLANRRAANALIDKMANAIYSNIRDEGEDIPARLRDGIEIKDLSFAYNADKAVLHNINAKFEAGKSYAVVGASGCGKSTLLSLLMAGHSDYSGDILYDGKELRNVSSHSLYEVISIIQQNVFIFNSTIKDNITMFRDFEPEEVERAISLSGLSTLIAERGADFKCGENGSGLSGGERQRISIARCLIRKTPVLLVDEATAALDAETAFQVSSSILELDGLTRIVVTHSLDEALLKKYDSVLVLKNGAVEERGTFDELMDKKGYFYSLFTVSQ